MRKCILILAIFSSLIGQTSGQSSRSIEIALGDKRFVLPMPVIDRKKTGNQVVCLSNGTLLQSTDTGETWEESTISLSDASLQSWVFSNKKGDFFLFERQGEELLRVSMSSDRGLTWKEMGSVELPGIEGVPSIFFDTDKESILLTYIKNTDCKLDIVFLQSSGGKKWTDPVLLNANDISCTSSILTNPDVIKGPQDYLFAVWSDNQVLYLDRSYNDGKIWLRSDIAIHKRIGMGPEGKPVMTVDGSESILTGSLYVVWADSLATGYDLKCSRSSNNGDFWTTPTIVHDEKDVRVYAPRIAVDQTNGFLYLTYFKELDDNQYDLYLTFSDDGAQTFKVHKMNEKPLNVPDSGILKWTSNFDVYKGKIVVNWSDFNNGNQTIFTKSLDRDDLKE